MFGMFRFFLATAVIVMHLTSITNIAGYQAVFSFYILSGYLMTRVLNETYGFDSKGRSHFLINRALRIFPPYWVAAFISFLIIMNSPDLARSMDEGLVLPKSVTDWLLNIFIIFHSPPSDTSSLIPVVWTLHVEWVYYLFMCFFVSRSKVLVYCWFIISLLLTLILFVYANSLKLPYVDYLYFSSIADSLPFSIGALVYFACRNVDMHIKQTSSYLKSIGLVISFYVLSSIIYDHYGLYFFPLFYINLIVSAYIVYKLHFLKLNPFWKGFDRFLGDLTYPMYLLHFPVSVWVTWSLFASKKQESIIFFVTAFLATILASWLLNVFVEKPLGNIRNIFRSVYTEKTQLADVPKRRETDA